LLEEIAAILGDPSTDNVVVLQGPPGVGKTELAYELARRQRDSYPGGTFRVGAGGSTVSVELAQVGRACLGLDLAKLSIDEQAISTFYALGRASSLLILDNAASVESVQPWLPLAHMPCHVVVTSVADCWDRSWQVVPVAALTDAVALDLVEQLAGPDLAVRHGARLVEFASGLPVQLVPRCLTLAKDIRRRGDSVIHALTDDTQESFGGVYERLDPGPRLVLHAAARFNTQRIIADELQHVLAVATGWDADKMTSHLDVCRDVQLLQGDAELRMHQLFAKFVHDTPPAAEVDGLLNAFIKAQADRLLELAGEVDANPSRADLATRLLVHSVDAVNWGHAENEFSIEQIKTVGAALLELGQFALARGWFEGAVAVAEKGNVDGRADHESLSASLHQVGYCLSSTGDFVSAREWYERAVRESEKGDIDGRVDHASLGASLDSVGYCLSGTGEFVAAREWYERAVKEREQGDIHGRVDHEGVASSLHQAGYCLSSTGEYAAAREWYERAVKERERGDIHGRVNHEGVGISLHQVGYCLTSMGEHVAAREWYERAVKERKQGDIHGRVNHEGVGSSLHGIAYCLANAGEFTTAREWYERAVKEREQGDIHGRVNHGGVGNSLHEVGYCLSGTGEFAAAREWYERAVKEMEQGDIHGRVDHENLGRSLHQVGYCLSCAGEYFSSRSWYERAVEEKERGGVYGRVDRESLGKSVRALEACLEKLKLSVKGSDSG
jgi:tetratricopeptide (TPR) repeat protein